MKWKPFLERWRLGQPVLFAGVRSRMLLVFAALAAPLVAEPVFAEDVPRALHDYVERPEPEFAWSLAGRHRVASGTVYDVELTSQRWRDIVWQHVLQIHEPETVSHPRHVLLFVTGGRNGRKPSESDMERGMALARLAQARVAMLYQVPNQPLFDGRFEDDLITETWLKFLESGDADWPLLFPMVKSAVKAMDAVQQIAEAEWNAPVDGFVVTGASKRGWTSWLSAVADQRVVAIAPMVIDVLNFHPQMRYQLETWGAYSEQIIDYSSKGLIKLENESPRELDLRTWMDPYTYRRQIKVPKLLINGTNDRYWVVDALNLYWDDLEGPKHVLYVPNAGHGLEGGREYAMQTLAAFFQHVVLDRPLPEIGWTHEDGEHGALRLVIRAAEEPAAVRLWVAHSPTKDFREARWEAQPLAGNGEEFTALVERPAEGHVALFGELQFRLGPLEYSLCTQIRRE